MFKNINQINKNNLKYKKDIKNGHYKGLKCMVGDNIFANFIFLLLRYA